MKNKFQVLNLNIWNQNYHWEKRYELIRDLISEEVLRNDLPVIAVFHEVINSDKHNQAEELAKLFPQNKHQFFEVLYKGGKNYGTLISYFGDLKSKEKYKLSQDSADENDKFPRIIGLCILDIGGIDLVIGSTYFAVSSEAQIRNSKESIEYIDSYINGNNSLPIVICADFNASPEEEPVQLYRRAGFKDVWADLDKEEFNSWPTDVDLVIENQKQKYGKEPEWEIKPRRIDYIFTKNLENCDIKKVGKKLLNLWHSDHWGQLGEFEFFKINTN